VRLSALRLLRRFAPRTSAFAARFAGLLDTTVADSEAQRNFIRESFLALPAFGIHAVPYAEQIMKARGVLGWNDELEAASVAFAELGIPFLSSLAASLDRKTDPSLVEYSVKHDRCLDKFRVCFPHGIFRGAEAHVFAVFEDFSGFMPDCPVHRDTAFTWSAWRTTVTVQTNASFTLQEGRRRRFARDTVSLEDYTVSCGGYDVSRVSLDQRFPDRYEAIVSMAKFNLERLESHRRAGWSKAQNHIATCCETLQTIVSDSDMEEQRLMLEGCSCGFCSSVLQVM
jgi:hypothetical protein